MRQRIIRPLSVLAVMAGITVVLVSAQSVSEEAETADTSESAGSGETGNREEEAQEEIQEKEIQEESHQEDAGDIFADSAVVDLGNHKVAYLTTSDELAGDYGYEDWIVFQKLDQGSGIWDDKTLYIPAEGTITAIAADDFNIQITTKVGQEIRDIHIPICFMLETDYVELLSRDKLAVLSAQPEVSSLPETVWTEEVGVDEKYEISFERISVPYTPVSSVTGGKYADYRLTVRDVEWPEWNATERELIFTTQKLGNYWARGQEIYCFIDGDWQLYARLIPSSDEEPPRMYSYEKEGYYKELDYYYIERRYEAGEKIGETILEKAPYRDEQSIWYDEREGNQELFPRGSYPWGTDEIEP